jgi:hypothetical protein
MSTTIWAPLAEIRMSDRTVRRLSAATVECYRLWLEQGRDAPPVRLTRAGNGFAIRDGRHRVAAALAAGHTLIEAEVRPIARLLWRLLHPREIAPHLPHLGTRSCRQDASLAPRRSGFDSRRLHFTPP